MTRHAGTHIMGDFPGDYVALANRSVTFLARRAGCYVHSMTEVDERRETVDAHPGYRCIVSGGGRNLLNVWAIGLYRLMTAHAETRCRKAHEVAGVRILVARVAVQAQRQVRFVTVGNRLLLAV
jgi:hypothetical protein